MSYAIKEFEEFLISSGYQPADKTILPDKIQRAYYDGEKKSSARFCVSIKDDGFGVGWVLSDKDARGKLTWHSKKNSRKLSPAEKKELYEKRQKQKKEAEIRAEENYIKVASEFTKYWKTLPKAETHQYLERKKIKPHGIRIDVEKNELIIPLYSGDGKLWGCQRIFENGEKKLLKGGKKKGCYYPLADKTDSKDIIILCEGFATGASIREATGYIVIVAFDTGNLLPVGEVMRKKYPDARLIFAADNDAWTFAPGKIPEGINKNEIKGDDGRWGEWKQKGLLYNPGISKAREAGAKVNAHVIFPEFRQEDIINKPTDFNDLHCLQCLEQVKNRISATVADIGTGGIVDNVAVTHDVAEYDGEFIPPAFDSELPPLEAYADIIGETKELLSVDNWQSLLITNEKGDLKNGSIKNIILYLTYHPEYAGIFRFNDFQKEVFVCRCPEWENEKKFEVHRLEDNDITQASASLEKYGFSADVNKVFKGINVSAELNKFHPAREYFENLKWDGQKRLDTWLTYYLGAEEENPDYLAFAGKKWLTAGVKRVFEPGCKFDHILVMEGEQGKGKSTAFETLATFGKDIETAYFVEGIKLTDIQDKDTIMKLQGSIIVELAELAGFRKKDDDEIKGWITTKSDRCRLPYGKTVTIFPRQFILCGTTNNYDYLKDATGNRRYWPFLSKSIDLEGLKHDREQLWAEAVYYYKQGLYLGPTPEEAGLAKEAQEKRQSIDAWETDVMDAVANLMCSNQIITTSNIIKEMALPMRDRDFKAQSRVSGIMQQNGYQSKCRRVDGRVTRCWIKGNS